MVPVAFSEAMRPVVHLRAVVVLLGRYPALAGVDLDVASGEAVLLSGPNGAGKTTLLRLCAGLLTVRSGTASVAGTDLVQDPRSVRSQVALLGHDPGLFPELTVEANLRFWARAHRVALDDAVAAASRFGLTGRLAQVSVASLSEGQKRRVGLASVLARRPRLWLLDEPFAGLDEAGRNLVSGVIDEVCADGAAVLFSSHELERGRALAVREVQLAGGHVTGVVALESREAAGDAR